MYCTLQNKIKLKNMLVSSVKNNLVNNCILSLKNSNAMIENWKTRGNALLSFVLLFLLYKCITNSKYLLPYKSDGPHPG